MTLANIP